VREGDFVSRVERVDRVDGGAEKDELHLLYLGRRHPLKGVEFLETAVRQLQISTRSTRSTRLNIELRIVSNAKGEELEKVWEWCDVLVLPTLSENFGLVVAEALERGKRVITTDGAPVWESLVVSDQSLVVSGDGCGIGVGYGGGLLYLKGFRDGSDEKRVELLKRAISTL
jgi:glycosyltransferase involved in cell wall biosynthesis